MISLELNGSNYTGWTTIKVSKSIDQFCGKFELSITGSLQSEFPVTRMAPVKLNVDGVTVLTGYIDKITVTYADNKHDISVVGRDRAMDVLDSTVDGQFEFNPPISVVNLVKAVLKANNITLNVIDKTSGLDDFTDEDKVTSHLGASVFDMLEGYCRLRQVFLTTDAAGNVVLFNSDASPSSGAQLLHKINGQSNNILSATLDFDDSARFNTYNLWSQGNVSQLADTTDGSDDPAADSDDISDRQATATDAQVRKSRILNLVAEHASGGKVGRAAPPTGAHKQKTGKAGTATDIDNRAQWEANIRKARSTDIDIVVYGHTKTGNSDPWMIFETVQIEDDFADVSAVMLIKGVSYSQNLSDGSTTTLTLTSQDAFVLQAEEDARTARDNRVGDKLDATADQGDDDSSDQPNQASGNNSDNG